MKEDVRGENIDVSSEAIAALASQAASDIGGVTVIQQRPVESLTSRVKREFVHMGVKVNREDEACNLSIYIKVDFGKNIPGLAQETRNKVKEYVEGITDIKVEEIEIIVEDIELPS